MDLKARSSSMSPDRPFTVVVEGNIGSGKSTFLAHFTKALEDMTKEQQQQQHDKLVEILAEPVDKWRDVNGHNLLQLMYSQPGRWSMAFQSYVQLTMVKLHLRRGGSPIKMMERSLHSGRYCFIENLYRSGKLPGSEYSVLDNWYKFLIDDLGKSRGKFDMGVDLVVYLRTTPEVAWQRVKKRARTEEDLIPLDYLQELHGLHEEWLMGEDKARVPAPVLVLDADQDIYETPEVFTAHCAQIFDLSKNSWQRPESKLKSESIKSSEQRTSLSQINR